VSINVFIFPCGLLFQNIFSKTIIFFDSDFISPTDLNRDGAFAFWSACLVLAFKFEEYNRRSRDAINICYSVQHPGEPMLVLNDEVCF
jgi:hypothetical protein